MWTDNKYGSLHQIHEKSMEVLLKVRRDKIYQNIYIKKSTN